MLPSLKELIVEIKHKLCMCACFVCLQDARNRKCELFTCSTSFPSFFFFKQNIDVVQEPLLPAVGICQHPQLQDWSGLV